MLQIASNKVVFIENEALLLCLTMPERARAFPATIWCVTFLFSLWHFEFQVLWYTFQIYFAMGTRHFQKVVLGMKLLLSLYPFICHIGV